MKYVMSWTDALAYHHDLPFIPLHCTYISFTSSPQFTSLDFTAFLDDFPPTPCMSQSKQLSLPTFVSTEGQDCREGTGKYGGG
jgi:hypothetical protein